MHKGSQFCQPVFVQFSGNPVFHRFNIVARGFLNGFDFFGDIYIIAAVYKAASVSLASSVNSGAKMGMMVSSHFYFNSNSAVNQCRFAKVSG